MAKNYKLTQTGQAVQDDLNKIEGASIEGGTIHIGGNSITPLTEETDPTVPAWAKAAEKPSYTADEVGALPDDTTLADLPDDTGHRTVSDAEKAVWDAKSDFSGDYPDLTNKPDLSQFITRSVDDLVNYYLKNEVYTKDEVADLLAGITGGIWVPVSVLPQPSAATYGLKIYLVPSQEPATQNQKDEFITMRTGSEGDYLYDWERIGTTAIDLSEYVTNEDLQSVLEDYVSTEAFQQAMAGKQDTLVSGTNIKTINGDSILGSGNITAGDPNAVKYTAQSLTDAQKTQARTNIEAIGYDVEGSGTPVELGLEKVQNKVTSLSNGSTDVQYPSAKAVFDLIGKWGVVSQTQTWTQAADGGYDYTMSNFVYGLIPKANIDLFVSAGVVFNETTGYFELNGLTDISYEEMKQIYDVKSNLNGMNIYKNRASMRTVLPNKGWYYQSNFNDMFNACSSIEVTPSDEYRYYPNGGTYSMFNHCGKLKSIGNRIYKSTNLNYTFADCYSLENVDVEGLSANVSLGQSSRLSIASVVYMVKNAANTSAITITLHPTAYARCQADTTEYTYNSQTYTGILAYAAAKNISIASA